MTEPVLVRTHYRGGGAGGSAPSPPGESTLPPPDDGGAGGGGVMSQRMGPLPVWGWLALAGVLAVGAFFWIRRGQSGAAASSSQAATAGSTAGTATDTGCYDAGGNSVPCSEADYASEIAGLQSEIDNMQGSGSTPVSTPGAGSTLDVTVPDVVGDGAIQARATVQAAGLVPVVQGGSRGTVTAQSPTAGTVEQMGTQVTLTVTGNSNNGQALRTLPRQQQVTLPST